MWNANLLRGCCSLVLLALLLVPVGAHAQSGFILTAPGTSRASCPAITSPVTNQTWCADGTGAPSTYLWKVWNGTTYVTVGGGGGGTGGVCGIAGFVTIAGTDTTGTVTFGTPQPDTSYIVTVSTSPDAGMPPGVLAWYRNKTVNGFTVEITAAPGAGNSVDVSWIVSTNNVSACGTGSVTGSGTPGTLPVWVTSTSLGNSIVSQTANTLTVSKGSSALQTIQASAATSGAGAELVLHGGVATSGIGGGVALIGGLPSANTLEGGFIEMFGAVGTPGGHIRALAGNSTSGAGGFVTIAGGSSPGTGGQVSISGGGGTGSGTGGNLVLSAGPGTTAGHVLVNVAGGGTVSGAGSMLVNMLGSNTLTTPDTFQVEGGTINSIGFANVFPTLTTDGTFILGHDNDTSGIPIHSWSAAVGWSVVVTALDSFGFGSFQTVGGVGPNGAFGDHITINAGSNNFAFGQGLTITGTNDSFAFGGGGSVNGPNSIFLGSASGNGGVTANGSVLVDTSGHVVNVTGNSSMGFAVPPSSGNPIVTVSGTNSTLFWLDGGTSTLSGNNSFVINLKGTLGTFSNNNTFLVSASNTNTMFWAEDGVTTFFYNQDPTGVIWGGSSTTVLTGTGNDATNSNLEASDSMGTTTLSVKSPKEDATNIGNVGLIPWGSRTASDGKVTELRFYEAKLSAPDGNFVGFKAPDPIASNVMWTLPNADAKGFFSSSGSGVLSIGTTLPSVIFTALGTPTNGTMLYCSDCDPTATLLACTHAGAQTGAFAYRVNGAWKCMG